MPGSAAMPAPEQPQTMHAVPMQVLPMQAGMDCDGATHKPAPRPHAPAGDCCMVNVCAMSLALPVAPSGVTMPVFARRTGYALRTLRQPDGIVAAPIPHPPKSRA